MAITVEELDIWVKSNWTKKFDKKTGLGDPITLGLSGSGIFDLYQDLKTGDMYVWALNLEQYETDVLFKGFVKSQSDITSLLPLNTGEYVLVYENFELPGTLTLPVRIGDIITVTTLVNDINNLQANSIVTQSSPVWSQSGGNTGGIGVHTVSIGGDRSITIANEGGEFVTSVQTIYDVFFGVKNVAKSGAEFDNIALASADNNNIVVSIAPGEYLYGTITFLQNGVLITGTFKSFDDYHVIITGPVYTSDADKFSAANIQFTNNFSFIGGVNHSIYNCKFIEDLQFSDTSALCNVYDSQFQGDLIIGNDNNSIVTLYRSRFSENSTIINNSSIPVVLIDTIIPPANIIGPVTIAGMYGDEIYSLGTYENTIIDTTDHKVVIVGDDGQYKSMNLSEIVPVVNYTNATPTPTALGGIEAGSTFDNVSVQGMFDLLLYPYQAPSFVTFGISGLSSSYEVGTSIAGTSRTATWTTSNASNINANTVDIVDVTNSNTLLAENVANDGSETITLPTISKSTNTTHVFRIEAINSKNSTFSRNLTISWQWALFYGESTATSVSSSDILALRVKTLVNNSNGTFNFIGGGYKYFCYPTSFGLKTTFKDQATNLDVAMLAPQTVSVTNTNGVATNYYVHRTLNQLGGNITIIVS
jgi:hypothetical protein